MDTLAEKLHRINPRKICVIKPSSLGDVVHALPILPALRKLFPHSEISWVVNNSFRSLLEGHRDLDHVIAYDRGGSGVTRRSIGATARLCARLLDEKFDLTIDLQGLLRSGLMTAATRSDVRLGLDDAREGAGWFYTDRVSAPRKSVHAVDRVLRIARVLGDPDPQPAFHLPLGESHFHWARETLGNLPRPLLVVNMGARWLTKRWPPEHFAEVARRAVVRAGASIVAVGAPEDRPLTQAFGECLGPISFLDLSGKTTLLQLAAIARLSDLFLSNDTGPLHLAAAADAAVVGIYTCTNPRLTGPYGKRATVVKSCVWCAPSFRKTCDRLECLAELSPDRIWPVVLSRLQDRRESAA